MTAHHVLFRADGVEPDDRCGKGKEKMSSCKVIVKRVLMLMLGVSAVFNCSSGVADSLYDIDRAVTGVYSV